MLLHVAPSVPIFFILRHSSKPSIGIKRLAATSSVLRPIAAACPWRCNAYLRLYTTITIVTDEIFRWNIGTKTLICPISQPYSFHCMYLPSWQPAVNSMVAEDKIEIIQSGQVSQSVSGCDDGAQCDTTWPWMICFSRIREPHIYTPCASSERSKPSNTFERGSRNLASMRT